MTTNRDFKTSKKGAKVREHVINGSNDMMWREFAKEVKPVGLDQFYDLISKQPELKFMFTLKVCVRTKVDPMPGAMLTAVYHDQLVYKGDQQSFIDCVYLLIVDKDTDVAVIQIAQEVLGSAKNRVYIGLTGQGSLSIPCDFYFDDYEVQYAACMSGVTTIQMCNFCSFLNCPQANSLYRSPRLLLEGTVQPIFKCIDEVEDPLERVLSKFRLSPTSIGTVRFDNFQMIFTPQQLKKNTAPIFEPIEGRKFENTALAYAITSIMSGKQLAQSLKTAGLSEGRQTQRLYDSVVALITGTAPSQEWDTYCLTYEGDRKVPDTGINYASPYFSDGAMDVIVSWLTTGLFVSPDSHAARSVAIKDVPGGEYFQPIPPTCQVVLSIMRSESGTALSMFTYPEVYFLICAAKARITVLPCQRLAAIFSSFLQASRSSIDKAIHRLPAASQCAFRTCFKSLSPATLARHLLECEALLKAQSITPSDSIFLECDSAYIVNDSLETAAIVGESLADSMENVGLEGVMMSIVNDNCQVVVDRASGWSYASISLVDDLLMQMGLNKTHTECLTSYVDERSSIPSNFHNTPGGRHAYRALTSSIEKLKTCSSPTVRLHVAQIPEAALWNANDVAHYVVAAASGGVINTRSLSYNAVSILSTKAFPVMNFTSDTDNKTTRWGDLVLGLRVVVCDRKSGPFIEDIEQVAAHLRKPLVVRIFTAEEAVSSSLERRYGPLSIAEIDEMKRSAAYRSLESGKRIGVALQYLRWFRDKLSLLDDDVTVHADLVYHTDFSSEGLGSVQIEALKTVINTSRDVSLMWLDRTPYICYTGAGFDVPSVEKILDMIREYSSNANYEAEFEDDFDLELA